MFGAGSGAPVSEWATMGRVPAYAGASRPAPAAGRPVAWKDVRPTSDVREEHPLRAFAGNAGGENGRARSGI
ncbi:hypothetical protein GCM10027294_22860 [Marinactinospora endophytica]